MEDRKRSRGYPGSDLEASIENLRSHAEANGFSPVSREDISRALGSATVTGGTARKIGAMVSFGLLDRSDAGYTVSPLGKKLLRPLPGEEVSLRLEALKNAPLYKEILDRFADDRRIPTALGTILERFHGIMPPNGDYAAKVFLDSARYAGVIDSTGSFVDLPADSPEDEAAAPLRADVPEPTPVEHTQRAVPPPSSHRSSAFRFELPVGGALISVSIPEEATTDQIDLLIGLLSALKTSRQA